MAVKRTPPLVPKCADNQGGLFSCDYFSNLASNSREPYPILSYPSLPSGGERVGGERILSSPDGGGLPPGPPLVVGHY